MKGLRVKLESGWRYKVKKRVWECCSQLRGHRACLLTLGWGKMRFTCTSSACSPWGPSASVTVQRSSFEALQSKQGVTGIRDTGAVRPLGGPAPRGCTPGSDPANVTIVVLGAEREASEGEAPQSGRRHGMLPSHPGVPVPLPGSRHLEAQGWEPASARGQQRPAVLRSGSWVLDAFRIG